MKKLAFIAGTLGVIIVALAILFKLHHWEYAGIIMKYGTLFNCIIVLPIVALYLFKGSLQNKNLLLYGVLSAFILICGLVFKFNHWPGSTAVHVLGTALFIVFTVLFANDLYNSIKE